MGSMIHVICYIAANKKSVFSTQFLPAAIDFLTFYEIPFALLCALRYGASSGYLYPSDTKTLKYLESMTPAAAAIGFSRSRSRTIVRHLKRRFSVL